jgi:hypothetical protein
VAEKSAFVAAPPVPPAEFVPPVDPATDSSDPNDVVPPALPLLV